MSDIYEHNPGDHEDPLAGPTWTVGIAGSALLAVSVLVVAAIFYDARTTELEVKVLDQPTIDLDALRMAQAERLAGPIRIERRSADEESLVIPIDRAMDLIVEEMGTP
jgi:hypothetical protein